VVVVEAKRKERWGIWVCRLANASTCLNMYHRAGQGRHWWSSKLPPPSPLQRPQAWASQVSCSAMPAGACCLLALVPLHLAGVLASVLVRQVTRWRRQGHASDVYVMMMQ
jgi:hypothetical protein